MGMASRGILRSSKSSSSTRSSSLIASAYAATRLVYVRFCIVWSVLTDPH